MVARLQRGDQREEAEPRRRCREVPTVANGPMRSFSQQPGALKRCSGCSEGGLRRVAEMNARLLGRANLRNPNGLTRVVSTSPQLSPPLLQPCDQGTVTMRCPGEEGGGHAWARGPKPTTGLVALAGGRSRKATARTRAFSPAEQPGGKRRFVEMSTDTLWEGDMPSRDGEH